ncbi:hypothetical protein H696_02421 [Fonticula alba]|uniref:Uncharacterized protein n=1 Tax=Fonticula alba TaxID=691883 RepID=A0A058ZAN3_FONAL|nr:hypothetical protein H696_02421 [Fonticula alba]KCV71475.1 hypothetical protein H696_02421 [Fonticula alba]|eukprot:XP_009494598.1 hypothetical protein H696_02421 [Fonticula alba]
MVPIAVSFASKAELSAHLRSSTSPEQLVVIYIWADWHPSHANMAKVFASLGVKYSHANIQLLTLDASADSSSALLSELDVEAVPTFLFFKNSTPVGRVSGSSPQLLNQQFAAALSASVPVAEPAPTATPTPAPAPNAADLVPANLPLQERLAQLVAVAPCTIFIKGTPEKPRCGFTRQLLQILHDNNVSFASFDILEDNEVREGLKKFSDWPTYPQVYVKGELLGGLDILKQMDAGDELAEYLGLE